MKNKRFLVTLVLAAAVILFFVFSRTGKTQLVSPTAGSISKESVSPSPTPPPSHVPKTFNFDSSTDLKAELDKVDPQVLDSDFE